MTILNKEKDLSKQSAMVYYKTYKQLLDFLRFVLLLKKYY